MRIRQAPQARRRTRPPAIFPKTGEEPCLINDKAEKLIGAQQSPARERKYDERDGEEPHGAVGKAELFPHLAGREEKRQCRYRRELDEPPYEEKRPQYHREARKNAGKEGEAPSPPQFLHDFPAIFKDKDAYEKAEEEESEVRKGKKGLNHIHPLYRYIVKKGKRTYHGNAKFPPSLKIRQT